MGGRLAPTTVQSRPEANSLEGKRSCHFVLPHFYSQLVSCRMVNKGLIAIVFFQSRGVNHWCLITGISTLAVRRFSEQRHHRHFPGGREGHHSKTICGHEQARKGNEQRRKTSGHHHVITSLVWYQQSLCQKDNIFCRKVFLLDCSIFFDCDPSQTT